MIRVAFVLAHLDANWIGGVNYYHNLLKAISLLPERKICPVIFVGKKTDLNFLSQFPSFQVVRNGLFDRLSIWWWLNRGLSLVGMGNYLITRLMVKNNIDVNSHTSKGNPHLKTIGWIADFQFLHLPEFFSKKERLVRDKQILDMATSCTSIILSSNDARKDFLTLASAYEKKARVLHFVSTPSRTESTPLDVLQKKYEFDRPYFYVPNQFWAHKNHQVIVDALDLLKEKFPNILVLSSGNTNDYRNPKYFLGLIQRVKEIGVAENFKVLGVIPYNDVTGLMLNSLSVINPSMFEGWSTTVEEAKSLGVPLLLSNIPVHIEQACESATFFTTRNASDLAEKMIEIINHKDTKRIFSTLNVKENEEKKLIEFGMTYQEIVMKTMRSSENVC